MSANPFTRVKSERRAIRDLALRTRNLERRPQQAGARWALAWNDTAFSYTYPGGGGRVYVDLPNFATNAESVFGHGTDSYGGGVQTVKFLTEGVYKFHLVAQLFGPTVGQEVTLYYDVPLIQSKFQYPNPAFVPVAGVQDDMGFWELLYGDTPNDGISFPVGGGAWFQTGGADSFTAYVSMYVEQISTSRIALS